MFKTSLANIAQIKATISAYSECWYHGCGNIYVDKSESDIHQQFANPNSDEAVYRVHFKSVGQVPATVEELNKRLMQSRNQELIQEKMPKSVSGVKTVSVPAEETQLDSVPASLRTDDEELQRLIKEEEERQAAEEKAKKEAAEKAKKAEEKKDKK